MNIGAAGVITNEYNQILLILRDDTQTWAAPAGALELGELPTDGVVREVEEETGLKTMPVRLTTLNYRPLFGSNHLQFVFRCIQNGGELQTSDESLDVAYFKRRALPNMLALSWWSIEEAWSHVGPPIWRKGEIPWALLPRILWLKYVVYPRLGRERRRQGKPPYVPPPPWTVINLLRVTNANGAILTVPDGEAKRGLPAFVTGKSKAPWEQVESDAAAALGGSVSLTRLSGVFVCRDRPEMVLFWDGVPQSGQIKEMKSPKVEWIDLSKPADLAQMNRQHHAWLTGVEEDYGDVFFAYYD